MPTRRSIRVHAPDAIAVSVSTESGATTALERGDGPSDADWGVEIGAIAGERYWLTVTHRDGRVSGPLLDPHCLDLEMTPNGPRSVLREPWAVHPQGPPLDLPDGVEPVVYELHARGFAGTFAGIVDRLDYLADLGVDVLELMPVHPFDPADNYWGYMPLVWGAVHRSFASVPERAAEELAALVAAAHDRGMHVWVDVVFNHTGEGDATLPTWCLRGIDDAHAYRHRPDGSYTDDSGCGNDIDPADVEIRALVLEALERYADLGIDGFRFDLASLLTRDGGGLVGQISAWAHHRQVRLIAEPWDLTEYQLGDAFCDPTWAQWNDRFRDQVRGFLRAEPGLVPALIERVGGSGDIFGDDWRSVNFVTAHDGLTMHDLTVVTSDHHHSWNCGKSLRMQQLKNYFTMLLLSTGTPMFVMGDEFARTQHGNPNPYNLDTAVSWVDWNRLDEWRELHDFVRRLLRLRRECPPVGRRFFGVGPLPDLSTGSHSLAWATDDLYVMANAWWGPLLFTVQELGDWRLALATVGDVVIDRAGVTVPPRSICVLRR